MSRQYPLTWPANEPRTPADKRRDTSPFSIPPDKALRDLYAELRRFHAVDVILSTNVPVRADGYIYQDAARRRIEDPGAALFFSLGQRKVSICCDLYSAVNDNIRALGRIIEAMRTIERYGGQHLSDKSFTGFVALPPPKDCWKTLGIQKSVAEALNPRMRREFVLDAFREKAREGHADVGAAGVNMSELKDARDEALKQLGVTNVQN